MRTARSRGVCVVAMTRSEKKRTPRRVNAYAVFISEYAPKFQEEHPGMPVRGE